MDSEASRPVTIPPDPDAEKFYGGALRRIQRLVPVLGVLLAAAAWRWFGLPAALGFAVGGAIAYLNFIWLERVVSAFADALTAATPRASRPWVVVRFLGRYFLIALGAYAIFKSYPASLGGLLVGLLLPVPAIACEAVYEAYAALRRNL
jgi:hypothetical protein